MAEPNVSLERGKRGKGTNPENGSDTPGGQPRRWFSPSVADHNAKPDRAPQRSSKRVKSGTMRKRDSADTKESSKDAEKPCTATDKPADDAKPQVPGAAESTSQVSAEPKPRKHSTASRRQFSAATESKLKIRGFTDSKLKDEAQGSAKPRGRAPSIKKVTKKATPSNESQEEEAGSPIARPKPKARWFSPSVADHQHPISPLVPPKRVIKKKTNKSSEASGEVPKPSKGEVHDAKPFAEDQKKGTVAGQTVTLANRQANVKPAASNTQSPITTPGPLSTPQTGRTTPSTAPMAPTSGPTTTSPGATTTSPGQTTPLTLPSTPSTDHMTPTSGPTTTSPGQTGPLTPSTGQTTPTSGPATTSPGLTTTSPGQNNPLTLPSTPSTDHITPTSGPTTTSPGQTTPLTDKKTSSADQQTPPTGESPLAEITACDDMVLPMALRRKTRRERRKRTNDSRASVSLDQEADQDVVKTCEVNARNDSPVPVGQDKLPKDGKKKVSVGETPPQVKISPFSPSTGSTPAESPGNVTGSTGTAPSADSKAKIRIPEANIPDRAESDDKFSGDVSTDQKDQSGDQSGDDYVIYKKPHPKRERKDSAELARAVVEHLKKTKARNIEAKRIRLKKARDERRKKLRELKEKGLNKPTSTDPDASTKVVRKKNRRSTKST
ncbi:unnamed protein product [Bursaphelenchus okinawaensis]|uniref:Uncharacterized protein n=1 Tax=Bursaphelenchus okinawaensis TaxID=465554 RepID=A0A811LP17_9BILA|nr:unnamed protein product [Bursaphelenchus okinawaensis]CAG9127437.1 unnamed protein product [Bursaphelenchus okinawaensis]